MNLETLSNSIPDYAKDIKLNLGNLMSETGAPGLNQIQIYFTLLTAAYTTRNADIIAAMTHATQAHLTPEDINAAKAAAVIMAMNNNYYRFTHAMKDDDYATMPANLRMTIMGKPGTDKINFELGSLAASVINGCNKCMNAHADTLEKAGISKTGIQSAARIASVMAAAALAREIS